MTNLLKETENILKEHDYSFDDVLYIVGSDGNEKYEINVKDFINVANTFEYNESFGKVYVPLNIYICGNDWWLEREEYDGSECWVFKTKPACPLKKGVFSGFKGEHYPRCEFK